MNIASYLRPFGAVLFGLLVSCATGSPDSTGVEKPYFDLKGLLGEQIALLVEAQPGLTKSTTLQEETAGVEASPTTAEEWQTELTFFLDADINKPILLDVYEEATTEGGVVYTPKEALSSGVQRMQVRYTEGQVTQVLIETAENNALYSNRRSLSLDLEPTASGVRLTTFAIEGTQKMVMQSEVGYKIVGVLGY